MGRDFTPRELLASEAVLGDLFEVQRNLIITIGAPGAISHPWETAQQTGL